LAKEIYGPTGAFRAIEDFFENITSKLIKERSFKLGDYCEMDAVREYFPHGEFSDGSVGNMAFSNFFSQLFNIRIKTEANPHGLIMEEELFEILGAIFAFLFFNFDEVTA
jgi:hypothetical protein